MPKGGAKSAIHVPSRQSTGVVKPPQEDAEIARFCGFPAHLLQKAKSWPQPRVNPYKNTLHC